MIYSVTTPEYMFDHECRLRIIIGLRLYVCIWNNVFLMTIAKNQEIDQVLISVASLEGKRCISILLLSICIY
jgi:hypothetical protein